VLADAGFQGGFGDEVDGSAKPVGEFFFEFEESKKAYRFVEFNEDVDSLPGVASPRT